MAVEERHLLVLRSDITREMLEQISELLRQMTTDLQIFKGVSASIQPEPGGVLRLVIKAPTLKQARRFCEDARREINRIDIPPQRTKRLKGELGELIMALFTANPEEKHTIPEIAARLGCEDPSARYSVQLLVGKNRLYNAGIRPRMQGERRSPTTQYGLVRDS